MRDDRMLFWIADATGHGAAAALLTTLAKLLFHHANGENESIASTSPPLGLVAGSSFSETPVRLSSGDLFLLYTDGLYGAGDTDHPRLAPAMVAKQLLAVPGNAQSFLQHLLRDSVSSSTTPVPPDDIAALVVRRF